MTEDRAELVPPAPVRLVRLADLRGLTGAELFQCLARAGLTRRRLPDALSAIQDDDGNPTHALAGMRFLQAAALELALRSEPEPAPTWDDAQRWNVTADLTEPDTEPELERDRREYRVAASIATGLPPDAAEAMPLLDVEAFAVARGAVRAGVEG